MKEIDELTQKMVEAALVLKQINGEEVQYVPPKVKLEHVYCKNYEKSILEDIKREAYFNDLIKGGGNELKTEVGRAPKFNSIVSSAALAVSTFAPWKNYLDKLSILIGKECFSGFKSLGFEHKTRKPKTIGGQPPNLDVWLENDDSILAIECKFCECLERISDDKKTMSESYKELIKEMDQPLPWVNTFKKVINANGICIYKYFHAKQILCHYFGMTTAGQKEKHLLYLYWRPENENWKDIEPYKQHEDELKEFSELVKDATDVKFYSMTYQDLWEQWAKLDDNDGAIKKHIAALKKRYSVTIYEKSKTKK
ncbi:MAG: hypothetical protein PHC50_09430 [Candidatus Cloacimonetes bacterium]|nr:hypothetical protein [Candidatus Cloacimonadota bacterium]